MIHNNPILTEAEKFHIISKNLAEGVIIINDNGTIEEWNDYMVDKTRYPRTEILGKKIWDVQYSMLTKGWQKIYNPESLQKTWMNFISNLGDNEHVIKEGQFLTWNKEVVLTEDVICRINLQNKNFLYVIQRDRGTRRNVEHTDIITTIVSYELKSLISSLLKFSDLFKSKNRELNIDKLLNFIREIIASSEHTLKLLENLLVLLSIQKGSLEYNPEKTSLNRVFEDIIREFQSQATLKNIVLDCLPASGITCTADIHMLKIVLRNLVDNSLKFTNEHGNVSISASIDQDHVEIKVSDNGSGIDHETIKKLFLTGYNVSTQGTRGEDGLGLGLIICKELVERQGGRIWVESTVKKGSSFIFTIPS